MIHTRYVPRIAGGYQRSIAGTTWLHDLLHGVAADMRTFRTEIMPADELARQFFRRFPEAEKGKPSYRVALDAAVALEFAHARVYPTLPDEIRNYESGGVALFRPAAVHELTDAFFAIPNAPVVERWGKMKGVEADLYAAGIAYDAVAKQAVAVHDTLMALNNKGLPPVQLLRLSYDNLARNVGYLAGALKEDPNRYAVREERRRLKDNWRLPKAATG